jgi:hypothetical protein
MSTSGGRSPLKRDLRIRTRVSAAAKALLTPESAAPVSATPPPAPPVPPPAPAADVDVLAASPLFDVAWYATVAGCKAEPRAAARHYLKSGHRRGLSPHPLFDPRHFLARLPEEERTGVPFLLYLARADSAEASPGPLFDAAAYAAEHADAATHPHGILAHYLEHGVSAGARPNDWYTPGAAGLPPNIADWVRARRAEWQARRDALGPAEAGALAEVDRVVPAARPTAVGTVSVVVTTSMGWWRTTRTVRQVTEAAAAGGPVQVVVVDNGCGPETATMLDALPLRFPGVDVVHHPVDDGFGAAANRGLARATGAVVVFLDHAADVAAGWLEPLVEALAQPDVLGAQPLLMFPRGVIRSAGVAFPSCGGLPHALLEGFPPEDAAPLGDASFSALSAAALAVRHADLVAVGGFDPAFDAPLGAADLGLRLRRLRPGRFTLRPESVVVQRDSKAPRPPGAPDDRPVFLERWGGEGPGDDIALWRHAGYDVLHHDACGETDGDPRLVVPRPVLARRRAVVLEGPPALRWALKIPALPDATAELWGDTHFARRLAEALRRLGQQVVIDHRLAFTRETRRFDDVALGIRGIEPYPPVYGQVNLLWLISHPDKLSRAEAASYDRVLAASVAWSERTSRAWGLRIDPLLQATDPGRFHPDLAAPDDGHRLLFVGRARETERPLVMAAVARGLPLAVYGQDWEQWIPARHLHGAALPNDRLGAAYRAAGVVLNDHWEQMRVEGFVSNRLFDAAAAGARVVTDDVAGLGDLFGRSVQVARDADDLVRLTTAPDLDAIFGDDAERRAVAARVHAEHSFDARARRLLDVACEVRASLSAARRDGVDT